MCRGSAGTVVGAVSIIPVAIDTAEGISGVEVGCIIIGRAGGCPGTVQRAAACDDHIIAG